MSTMLVFNRVFTDPSMIVSADKSSQQTAYPASNAYNLDRRRRTWRSAGYFEITASNNKIIFRESVGVDLTATIAVSNYTTDAAFLTAIKTAMDAAGASIYTVTRDTSTNRIKITSDGLGGGGVFQLMCTDINFTSADVIGFSTTTNLTGSLNYTADLLRIHTSEWLLLDLGIPTNPTGIIGTIDRNDTIDLTNSSVVKLQGNPTNSWAAPAFEQDLVINNGTISLLNEDGFYAGGLRYWRLYIESKDNPKGYVELGAVGLMEHLVLTRGCVVFPLKSEYQDRSSVVFSEGGRAIVTRRDKTQRFQLNWSGVDKASFEQLEEMWDQYGLHSSFFIAMDPNAAFSTNSARWCRLVKFDSAPQLDLSSPNNWAVGWELREEL